MDGRPDCAPACSRGSAPHGHRAGRQEALFVGVAVLDEDDPGSDYSPVRLYVQAIRDRGTDEPLAVLTKMRATQVNNIFATGGYIRDRSSKSGRENSHGKGIHWGHSRGGNTQGG